MTLKPAKPDRDVTFPVSFHGDRHWGVRVGEVDLPCYFAKLIEAQTHLSIMIYRRQHGGAMPTDLERFAAAQRRAP